MQTSRAWTSCLGVPLLPLARAVGWVAPVRPTLGLWFAAPCPPVALGAYAVTWSCLSTGARTLLCSVRGVLRHLALVQRRARCMRYLCVVGGFVRDPLLPHLPSFGGFFSAFCLLPSSLCFCSVFFMLSCFCLSSFGLFFLFFGRKIIKSKGGACTLQAQAWATGAAVQQCCLLRRGGRRRCCVRGPAPGLRHTRLNVHGCGLGSVRLGVSLRFGQFGGAGSLPRRVGCEWWLWLLCCPGRLGQARRVRGCGAWFMFLDS